MHYPTAAALWLPRATFELHQCLEVHEHYVTEKVWFQIPIYATVDEDYPLKDYQ